MVEIIDAADVPAEIRAEQIKEERDILRDVVAALALRSEGKLSATSAEISAGRSKYFYIEVKEEGSVFVAVADTHDDLKDLLKEVNPHEQQHA